MCEITQEQLVHVVEMVSNSDITYSHLPDDLIDHICCDIESEMSVGLPFNEALERVQCKFSDPGLQKIQEDTILLIDQKYRFMKTTMKIFGNVSLALIGIGTIFKIFHWPGATIGLVLGFLLLGLVFYPATILASYRKNGRKNIFLHILAILGGVALIFGILFKINHWPGASMLLSGGWMTLLILFLPIWLIIFSVNNKNKKETRIYSVGVLGVIIFELSTLFKIMHWPGAKIMLVVGAVLIVSVFLPMYAYSLYKKSDLVSGKFIYIILLTSFFLLFGLLINLNYTKNIFNGLSYTDKYANIETKYYNKVNSVLIQDLNLQAKDLKSNINLIHQKSDSLSNVIRELKLDLIFEEEELDKHLDNIDFIPYKTNGQIVQNIFFGEDNNGSALQLKKGLNDYKNQLMSTCEPDSETIEEIDNLLLTSDIPEYGFYKTWEYRTFKYNIVYMTLVQLSNIERDIKLAENLVLEQAAKQYVTNKNVTHIITE